MSVRTGNVNLTVLLTLVCKNQEPDAYICKNQELNIVVPLTGESKIKKKNHFLK